MLNKIPRGFHRPSPNNFFPKPSIEERTQERWRNISLEMRTSSKVFLKNLKRFARIRRWKLVKSFTLEEWYLSEKICNHKPSSAIKSQYNSFIFLPEIRKAFPALQRLSGGWPNIRLSSYHLEALFSDIYYQLPNLKEIQFLFKLDDQVMQALRDGRFNIKKYFVPLKKLSLAMDFSTPTFFQRDFSAFGRSLTKNFYHLDHLTLHFIFGDLGQHRGSYNKEFVSIMPMLLAPLKNLKELSFKFEDSPQNPTEVLNAFVEAAAVYLSKIESLELWFTKCDLPSGNLETIENKIRSQHKNLAHLKVICIPKKKKNAKG